MDKKLRNNFKAKPISCNATIIDTIVHLPTVSAAIFDVKGEASDAARRCNLTGSYRLQVTKSGLALWTMDEGVMICTWPYKWDRD